IVVIDDWTDGVGKSPQQLYSELTDPNKRNMPGMSEPSSTTTTTTTPTTTTTTGRNSRTTSTTPTTSGTSGTSGPSGPSGTSGTSSTSAPPPAETPNGVGKSDLLGGDAGDIAYPYYLINGRIPAAPTTFNAQPGQRIRIRFINTGSDTAFRVALAGHSM